MEPSTGRAAGRARRWMAIAVLAALALAAAATITEPRPPALTIDERDYLRAAVHLARDGALACAPVGERAPAPDAYREPAYPALLAAAWRLTGARLDFAEDDYLHAAGAATARRAARGLGLLLLALSAAAAGFAVAELGAGRTAAAIAALAVLASPALARSAGLLSSENLAAPLLALCAGFLIAGLRRPEPGWPVAAGLAAGLLPLARGAGVVAVAAGAALLASLPRALPWRRRGGRVALFLAPALLLPALWMTRNQRTVGHFLLADRAGAVFWTRAELDRQIGREGVLPALAEWTPLEAVRQAGRRRWPDASFDRYRWRGEGNFFTRAMRRWRGEREGSEDPIAADRRLARAALRRFLDRPGEHALATVAAGWRGLFAERAPAWLPARGLVLPLHLLLAAGWVLLLARAQRARDPGPLALLALPLALFAFHALATEFLPRFSEPALPLVWSGCVAGLAGLGERTARPPARA